MLWVILLFLLMPVSWIVLLLCWVEWQSYLETGVHGVDAMYLHPIGWLSFIFVVLQILFVIHEIRDRWR